MEVTFHMANRIIGSIYIIDTSSANTALPWPQGARVNTIRAWFLDTTGLARFTGSDTTNAVCILTPHNAPTPSSGGHDEARFGGVRFDEMKIPTLTAGTAWIYFS